MIARIIEWSMQNRFMVVILTLILVGWGAYAVKNTPLDAIPDLSDVQVIIKTTFLGQVTPLAYTKTFAMAAAGLSITLVPVLMGYFIRGHITPEDKNPINRLLVGVYRPFIRVTLKIPKLGCYVVDAQQAVREKVELPTGYSIAWSGQYEYMVRAKEKLATVVPVTLVTILLLLSLRRHRDKAAHDGRAMTRQDIRAAVIDGALLRVRPIMMTVAAIIAGLLPIMLGGGTGSEVTRRIAAPMVGGMVSATVHTLIVIPAVFLIWKQRGVAESTAEKVTPPLVSSEYSQEMQ